MSAVSSGTFWCNANMETYLEIDHVVNDLVNVKEVTFEGDRVVRKSFMKMSAFLNGSYRQIIPLTRLTFG